MAILEKEVLVTISGKSISYYENLNYVIPKINGKAKLGEKILVKVDDLIDGSHALVTKICDMDGCNAVIPNQQYCQILKSRRKGDGKDRCYSCGRSYSVDQRKNKIKYEKSLECFAKENNMEYLLSEFSHKNNKIPSEISRGTKDEYLWICPYGHEYEMSPKQRTREDNQNCPYCSNQRVLKGYNDLWTTHPNVADLLKEGNRGYEITHGTKKKEMFVCPECQYEEFKVVDLVSRRGFSCSRCGDGYSYPEKILFNVLNQLNINFETQKTFEWSKNYNHSNKKLSGNKRYDFYIPSLNCIIETHGEQHYGGNGFSTVNGRTFQEEQENDRLKEKLAKENGISQYTVIDCSESKLEFIKNNIINNNSLSKLITVNSIDWNICNEYATNSLVKLACEHWKNGVKSTIEIGKLMKLDCNTIAKYLKQGAELGWCGYNPKDAQIQALKVCANKNKKAVVQLTVTNEFVRYWDSASSANKILGINPSTIAQVCKGSYETAGSYKWMYKEDYKNNFKKD